MNKFLRLIAIAGNILYVFWLLRNSFDSELNDPAIQIVSSIGLIVLLLFNALLLLLLPLGGKNLIQK